MPAQNLRDQIPPDKIETKPTNKLFRDVEGQTFGRLTVLAYGGKTERGDTRWWWACSCGTVRLARAINFMYRENPSCGCRNDEVRSALARDRNTTHGATAHPLWNTFNRMRGRCHSETDDKFYLYGARGIRVCDEWLNDPWAFFAHMESLPGYGERGLTMDRIDNGRGYEPGNVRWATKRQQQRNMRTNRWLVRSDGRRDTICGWGRFLGSDDDSFIHARLRTGWSMEQALWTPKGQRRRTGP